MIQVHVVVVVAGVSEDLKRGGNREQKASVVACKMTVEGRRSTDQLAMNRKEGNLGTQNRGTCLTPSQTLGPTSSVSLTLAGSSGSLEFQTENTPSPA